METVKFCKKNAKGELIITQDLQAGGIIQVQLKKRLLVQPSEFVCFDNGIGTGRRQVRVRLWTGDVLSFYLKDIDYIIISSAEDTFNFMKNKLTYLLKIFNEEVPNIISMASDKIRASELNEAYGFVNKKSV